MLVGRLSASAATPPSTRTRMISSVAYADDEIASELKIASALVFESRSPSSSSLASGRPSATDLTRATSRPAPVAGVLAFSFARSWPGPVYRK